MLDWDKPLQTRSGLKATKLHEYYNGVQQMAVVSLESPSWTTGGKPVEIIKVYDMRWGKLDGKSSMTPANEWDLQETPPPDEVLYVLINAVTSELIGSFHDMQQNPLLAPRPVAGQIRVVIDGRTKKIKSSTIL